MPRITKSREDKRKVLSQVTTSDLMELSTQADLALKAAKTIEREVQKHLTTVSVGTALIRTTDPEKWEGYAKQNRQTFKTL